MSGVVERVCLLVDLDPLSTRVYALSISVRGDECVVVRLKDLMCGYGVEYRLDSIGEYVLVPFIGVLSLENMDVHDVDYILSNLQEAIRRCEVLTCEELKY